MIFGQEPLVTSPRCVTMGWESPTSATRPPAKSAAGTAASHWTVTLVGQVRAGGVKSTIIATCVQNVLLPHRSVARQMRVATKVLPQVRLVTVLTMTSVVAPAQLSVTTGVANSQLWP